MMAHETATLADYVAELKYQDIPPEVLERAKVLTLDFLGSAIRARRDAESTPSLLKMLEALALDGKGQSTVFGDAKTWTPAVAASLRLRGHAGGFVFAPGRAGGAARVRGGGAGRRFGPRRADRDRGRL